jgi:hypothetical protein
MMLERRQGSPATLLALDERNRLLREAALNGAVPTGTGFKRVRFRLGNVQIGGNALLEESPGLIPGRLGEVHILDRVTLDAMTLNKMLTIAIC